MKIKKNTFSTLVLLVELFFQSIANCRVLNIQKSTSPTVYTVLKGQSHEKVGEMRVRGDSLGHN
jgi:hypothetical protein